MSTAYVGGVTLVTEECCKCGMTWAITQDFQRRRVEDHQTFYCPAGHPQVYTGPTETTKLKRELERSQQILEAEQARSRRLQDEASELFKAHKKMRTRIMNGVCPCCNRTFENLMRHMRSEHASEVTLRNIRLAYGMTQDTLAKEIGVKMAYVSAFERDKPVPTYAKETIERWVLKQEKT